MFTRNQILKLFAAQYDLNTAYNGESWKVGKFIPHYQAAADVEFAEFLGELEGIWKWYYKGATNNFPEAMVEAIDVLHFQVATVLTAMAAAGLSKNDILTKVDTATKYADKMYQRDAPTTDFEKAYPRLRYYHGQVLNISHTMHRRNVEEGEWSSDFLLQEVLFHLNAFVAAVGGLLSVDGQKLFQVYEAKNARCHERVAKGVMNGVDVKKDEEPLDV